MLQFPLTRSNLAPINLQNRQNIRTLRLNFLRYKVRAIRRRRGLKKYVARMKRKNRWIRYFRKHKIRAKRYKREHKIRRKDSLIYKKLYHTHPILFWFKKKPLFIKTKASLALVFHWIKQLKKKKRKSSIKKILKKRKNFFLIKKSLKNVTNNFLELKNNLYKIYSLLKKTFFKRIKTYLISRNKRFFRHSTIQQPSYQWRRYRRRLFSKDRVSLGIFALENVIMRMRFLKKEIKHSMNPSELGKSIEQYFHLKSKRSRLFYTVKKINWFKVSNRWRYRWQLANFRKKYFSPHDRYTKSLRTVMWSIFWLFAWKMKQVDLTYPKGYNFAIKSKYLPRFFDKFLKYNIYRHRKRIRNSSLKRDRPQRKAFLKLSRWNRRLYRIIYGWYFNTMNARRVIRRRQRIKRLKRFTWRIFKRRRPFKRPLQLQFSSTASHLPHLLHMFAFWRNRMENLPRRLLPIFRRYGKRSLKIRRRPKLFAFKHLGRLNKLGLFPLLIFNSCWFNRLKINSFKDVKRKMRNLLFKLKKKLKILSSKGFKFKIRHFLRVKRFLRKPAARHAGFARLPGMGKLRNRGRRGRRRRRSKRHLYFNRYRVFKLQFSSNSSSLKSISIKKDKLLLQLKRIYTRFIHYGYSFVLQRSKQFHQHLRTRARLVEVYTRFVLIQRLFTNLYKRYDWSTKHFFFKPWIKSIGEKQLPLLKNLYFKTVKRSTLIPKTAQIHKTLFRHLRYIVLRARHRNMWLTVVNPDGTVAFSESFGTLGFHTKKSKKSLRLPTQAMFTKFKNWFNRDWSVITGSWYELKLKTAPTDFRLRKYLSYWIKRTIGFGQNPTILGRTAQRQIKLNRLRALLVYNEKELCNGESFVVKTLPLLFGLPLLVRKKFLSRYSQYRKNYTVLANHFLNYLQKRCILNFRGYRRVSFKRMVLDLLNHPLICSKLRLVALQCGKSIFSFLRILIMRGKFFKLLNQFSDTRKIMLTYFRKYRKPRKLQEWLNSCNLSNYNKFLKRKKTKGGILFRRRRRRFYRKKRYFKLAHRTHRSPIIHKFTRWATDEQPFPNIAIRIVKVHLNIPLSHGAIVKQKKAKRK